MLPQASGLWRHRIMVTLASGNIRRDKRRLLGGGDRYVRAVVENDTGYHDILSYACSACVYFMNPFQYVHEKEGEKTKWFLKLSVS